MRSALLAAALLGVFVDVFLLRRLFVLTVAADPLPPAVRPRPAPLDPDRGFVRRMFAPAAPLLFPSAAAFPLFWFGQTYEELVLGLLLISVVISIGSPLLSTELLLWSHRASRLDPEREADLIARLYRFGVSANEVWASQTPIVSFWQPSVHLPAVIAGSRVLVWDRLLDVDRERWPGIALARRMSLWPWALWPVFAAAGMRALDTTSVLPWWLFAIPIGLALLEAIPDTVRQLAVRKRLQTDAAAPAAVIGFLETELAAIAFIAGRGDGAYHRMVCMLTWVAAVRRARRAAARARMPSERIDEVVAEVAATPLAVEPQ